MFPMLTASSIILTLPVDDSHTGHNCFSMGLGRRREDERVKRGREWERAGDVNVYICMLVHTGQHGVTALLCVAQDGIW